MKIKGKYKTDQNFITICSAGTIYTIARNSGQVGSVAIGEYVFHGGKLTQKGYDQILSTCDQQGEFDV